MSIIIGIRREDKNRWERRVPVIPDHVEEISRNFHYEFIVQPSNIRVFNETQYRGAGAAVEEDLTPCKCIFAVKEIPPDLLLPDKTLIFFSHTIKGQSFNMPLLQRILDLKCTLIDYELMKDDQGKRLIFFGNFAGMAGMIDTFWALGRRLREEGHSTPFENIKPAHTYTDLNSAKTAVSNTGRLIRENGLPDSLHPMIFGFAGYGNVSRGAQDIFDLMPFAEIPCSELIEGKQAGNKHTLFKTVFREQDMVRPQVAENPFDLQEYYKFPERYVSRFHDYIPHLTVLMNCIYWDPRYPRLLTGDYVHELYGAATTPRLKVIGDITCDVNGAIQCTLKCTTPDQPVFVYDINKKAAVDGVKGTGPVILAIDHLPCELPAESSTFFSNCLKPFIPSIVEVDYSRPFDELNMDPIVKKAVITHQGKLTPDFIYLKKYLNR